MSDWMVSRIMPARISMVRRNAIIRGALHGLGRNEIARQVGENPVTVGRELQRFKDIARLKGVWEAGAEYGLEQEVEELYRVAKVAHEYKVSPEDLAEAAPVAIAVRQAGVEPSEVEQTVTHLVLLQRTGLVGEKLVEACKQVSALMEKFGSFDGAKASLEELTTKIPQLKEEAKQLEMRVKGARDKIEELYQEAGVTRDSIERFEKVAKKLKEAGLGFGDLDLTIQAIKEIKAAGFKARKVIVQLKREGNLQERINALENKIAELTLNKQNLASEIGSAKQELESLKPLLEEGRKLKDLGLSVSQLQKVRGVVSRVSVSHGLTPVQAFEKFYRDVLDYYDPLLGLEVKVRELNSKREELRKDKEKVESSISELKEEYRKLWATIDTYAKLKARGLKDETLLLLQRLVIEAGLAATDVITEIRDIAQLEERKNERAQELATLSREAEEKRLLLQDVAERRKKLEQETSEFLKGFLTELKKLQEEFASSILASKDNAVREADASVRSMNARVKQLNATITNATENVGQAVEAIGAEIQRLLEKARAASSSAIIAAREAGKLELQANIWRFLAGKDVDRASVFALLSSLVPRLLKWAEDENLYGLREKVLELKEELDDLVRYGTS